MHGKLVRPSLMAAFIVLLASPSLAHDSWIARGAYRGPVNGEWCCGHNDCFAIPEDRVHTNGVGYELTSHGETVPYREVLTSEDGKYWRCHRPDGSRRCFFAPKPSS
jgi:hypothetical protein